MNIIIYCSIISTIVLAIYGLSKLNIKGPVNWVVLYCATGAIVELVSRFFAVNGIPNIFLFYTLVWVETFILSLYFNSVSITIGRISRVWLILPIYLMLFLILVFLDNPNYLCPYSGIFQGLLVFAFGLISFNDELRTPKHSDILRQPFFWFVASFILYYGCSSIMLIGAKVYSVDKKIFNYIWNYQNVLTILKNIMIATGFILYRK